MDGPFAMLYMAGSTVGMKAFQLHTYFCNWTRICHFGTHSYSIGGILYICNFETWYYYMV